MELVPFGPALKQHLSTLAVMWMKQMSLLTSSTCKTIDQQQCQVGSETKHLLLLVDIMAGVPKLGLTNGCKYTSQYHLPRPSYQKKLALDLSLHHIATRCIPTRHSGTKEKKQPKPQVNYRTKSRMPQNILKALNSITKNLWWAQGWFVHHDQPRVLLIYHLYMLLLFSGLPVQWMLISLNKKLWHFLGSTLPLNPTTKLKWLWKILQFVVWISCKLWS